MKNKPCPFPPSVGRESMIPAENQKMLLEKYASERIPALKNSRFCVKTPFCFYMEKHLIKEVNNFWCCDRDWASTATHFEKFNRRMFLNIYFKIVSILPQKRLIPPLTAILFLHDKVLTERVGMLLIAQSRLCVDCYRIMWGIQQKGSLKQFLQNFSPLLPVKTADFMTHRHFVSSWKSIYSKRCSVFDGAIRIVHWLLYIYVRNSTQGFS